VTGNLLEVTSDSAATTGPKAYGLYVPIVLLAVANALDVVTTGALRGAELNPIAGWLLRHGWLAEAKTAAVMAVAVLALLASERRWVRPALWTAVAVYAVAVASNSLQLLGLRWR
jgi:hypothetical protein